MSTSGQVAAVLGRGVEVAGRLGALVGPGRGVGRPPSPTAGRPRPRRPAAAATPMLTRPTPGPPAPSVSTAATPTIAQSWARRLNFSNAQPTPGTAGTRISVSTSSGASAVSRKPVKKSSAAISARRRGPGRPAWPAAPAARRAGRRQGRRGRSSRRSCPGGAPGGRRPGPPRAASSGTCSVSRSDVARSWWRVSAPMRTRRRRLAPHEGQVARAGRCRRARWAPPGAASSAAAASGRRRAAWRRRRARRAAPIASSTEPARW